jgi:hypothetical protein
MEQVDTLPDNDAVALDQYIVYGNTASRPKYVMTVKLSTELFEQLSNNNHKNACITFGDDNKLTVDGKVYLFRANPEDKPHDCYCQEGDSFTEIGIVKRKIFFNQDLRQEDRKRIKSSASQAETERKKHKSVFLEQEASAGTPHSHPRHRTKPRSVGSTASVNANTNGKNKNTKPRFVPTTQKPPMPRRAPQPQPQLALLPQQSNPRPSTPSPPPQPLLQTFPNPAPHKGKQVQGQGQRARDGGRRTQVSTSTSTSTQPLVSNLRGIPLRTYLIHALALQPQSASKLEQRFGTKDVHQILPKVAKYQSPGFWYLKDDLYRELNVDTWMDYTCDDRDKVRSNIKEVLSRASTQKDNDKDKDKGSSSVTLSRPYPPTPPHQSSSMSCGQPQPQAPVNPQLSHPNSHTQPSIQPVSSSKSSSIATLQPITTAAQYAHYRGEYYQKYTVYRELDGKLSDNRTLFARLGDEWKAEKDPERKKQLSVRIESLYRDRHAEVERMQSQYAALHQELKAIKEHLKDYVEQRERERERVCIPSTTPSPV